MTLKLAEREHCTGCSACQSVCSRLAISMIADDEGFLFPVVNCGLCVECGACVRICPALKAKTDGVSLKCYAAKSRDPNVVAESSSGGMFSEFANQILRNKGVVFGAAYDENTFHVSHIMVESVSELRRLRGSKYVQSEIGNTYRKVKAILDQRRQVLFSGTPCQVAALRAYLGRKYENLFLVDVICHGVPSAKLFNLLKKELQCEHGKMLRVSFRDKSEGWRSRAITGWYEKKGKIRECGRLNDYFRAFIGHLSLRHSCESCMFNEGRSGADVTLGDFWGVERVAPEFDDNGGVSAVIVHSEAGAFLLSKIVCNMKEVALSDITMANPSYAAVRTKNPRRNKFMKCVWHKGISRAFAKCNGETLISCAWRLMVSVVERLK